MPPPLRPAVATELNLRDVLENIETGGLKVRDQGFTDLKHILRSPSRLQDLADTSVYRIYEVLFSVALYERSTYLKAKTSNTRSAAATRLTTCAASLRSAVEATIRLAKTRTTISVIDHVIQTLSLPSGGLCEPLALDYAKCLHAVLVYQPHVEHFGNQERERLYGFCLQSIKAAIDELSTEDSDQETDRTSSARATNGLSYRSSRSHLREDTATGSQQYLARQIVEEMMACLSLLIAAPTVAIGSQAEILLPMLIECLQNSFIATKIHQHAFTAINHILAKTRVENIALTKKFTLQLLRLMRVLLSAKQPKPILISWLYLLPYVHSLSREGQDHALHNELINSIQALRDEYSRLKEREQLHFDDLVLRIAGSKSDWKQEIGLPIFVLRTANAKAETAWAMIYILASLNNALSYWTCQSTSLADETKEPGSIRAKKRQRLNDELDDLFASASTGDVSARLCAVQTITFLAQLKALKTWHIAAAVDAMSSSIMDENAYIVSWSLLALASLASQAESSDVTLEAQWISVWRLATRAMANPLTCRAASHLVYIMLTLKLSSHADQSDLVRTISTSSDVTGPSILSDSSARLLYHLCDLARRINPATASALSETGIRWLCRHFTPSRFDDRTYASQNICVQPKDIIALLSQYLSQSSKAVFAQYHVWDIIGRVWVACAEQQDLLTYLLLEPDPTWPCNTSLSNSATNTHLAISHMPSAESLLLDHLINELTRAREAWTTLATDRPQQISDDIFSAFVNGLYTCTFIAYSLSFRDKRYLQLQDEVQTSLHGLSDFIVSLDCDQRLIDVLLFHLSSLCNVIVEPSWQPSDLGAERHLCSVISAAILARNKALEHSGRTVEDDGMEIDDAFESQDSRRSNLNTEVADFRDENAAIFSTHGLRYHITTYATLLTQMPDYRPNVHGQEVIVPSGFVDYIMSLPSIGILTSAKVISSLPAIGICLSVTDSIRLLNHCADTILEVYAYERSDVALSALFDILNSLAPLWLNPSHQALFDLGGDIYSWYTDVALKGGILSPNLQKRIAMLLLHICQVDAEYGRNNNSPSARTRLFSLIQLGNTSVQFYLSSRISAVFKAYVLSAHSKIFDDFQESLPDDSLWIEGIAMRLRFLAELAVAWHSLLRQSIYYLFETAGRIKSSGRHASRCVANVAKGLGIDSPQRLFTMFAPQLLHTWMEGHSITALPYETFQYQSLSELLRHNQSEAVAQLLMRGTDEDLLFVSTSLSVSVTDLVKQSFAKSLAYCISWDIAKPPAGSNARAESRLRKHVGSKEELCTLATHQFPVVVGHFFLTTQQDDNGDKWLLKRPEQSVATNHLREIQEYSYSDLSLPPGQQPSFKGKYLCDQIARLCRRTPCDPASPWTPASFCLTSRMLLDSIEPALGPLHATLVVRRLRLLVSLAGEVAFSGFPIERLVHSLRPLLSESHSADDTMGIMQYLLHHGRLYLQERLPFLSGIVMLAILQMRHFIWKSQDSPIQASQCQTTIQKMERFQSWLVEYIEKCQTSSPSAHLVVYKRLASSLARIHLPGNSHKDTPESELLLLLLEMQETGSHTPLSAADCKEALVILAENFEATPFGDDSCFESDAHCVEFSSKLWSSLQCPGLDEKYRVWAATGLGRAYATTGIAPVSPHLHPYRSSHMELCEFEGVERSQARIVLHLCNALTSVDRVEASYADHTLRSVASSIQNEEEESAFERMLPGAVVSATSGGTFGYKPISPPSVQRTKAPTSLFGDLSALSTIANVEQLTFSLAVTCCTDALNLSILPALIPMVESFNNFAKAALPAIVHIMLDKGIRAGNDFRAKFSRLFTAQMSCCDSRFLPMQQYLLQLLLFLREQPYPGETTFADRLLWLDTDLMQAAKVAARCSMPTTALLLLESYCATPSSGNTRATSKAAPSQIDISEVSQELLFSIFRETGEPDSFYAVEQPASLHSVLDRLDYEEDGYKSLIFRSGQIDSQIRRSHRLDQIDATGIVRSLSMLNMNGVNLMLLSSGHGDLRAANDQLLSAGRQLQQWDMTPLESTSLGTTSTFTVFQEMSRANARLSMQSKLNASFTDLTQTIPECSRQYRPQTLWFRTLASLVEVGEILSCDGPASLQSIKMKSVYRQSWMPMAHFNDFKDILSNRHILSSVLTENTHLQRELNLSLNDCREYEAESLLALSTLSRDHGHLQDALAAASQLDELAARVGGNDAGVDLVSKLEIASVLWQFGELTSSIRVLQDALRSGKTETSTTTGRSGLLAQLASQLADARLEKPEEILTKYLEPAVTNLQGNLEGKEAGNVFYELASFCDKQLQNPGNMEDLHRISKLRQNKYEEVEQLEQMVKSRRNSSESSEYKHLLKKAKQWYAIDDEDYQRLKKSRDTFVLQSLQNYLLALHASDQHDISVLRFFALWLENNIDTAASAIVKQHLPDVPSWKLVRLLNQLMSRLENVESTFQAALLELIFRICSDHPHHSLHHLYASTRKPTSKDQGAVMSRVIKATEIRRRLTEQFADDGVKTALLRNWFVANNLYNALAWAPTESCKGTKVSVKEFSAAYHVASKIPQLRVPPATITLPLRPDCDYKETPIVVRFDSTMRLMTGLSKPKKITALASDGKSFAALFKSGNDDLRQDAIMEQVFEEVNKMLEDHRETRQRNLQVRTYKVIPLAGKSGIIEFVPNSTSLSDFLTPAHPRYYPKDYKPSTAREKIQAVKDHATDVRVKEFRKVCDHMHPVLRHFFFEKFTSPDEWFQKRTAYTRTTASVSILGHVLGLGDRHCQNIMLDEKTGEVIHIDLGVAFEAGRVLPIPELVPFRLSRDIVDGMGITKTEGIFRRCCEFTLDALRRDKDSIMTLLNVLRYDPLYQWTISPVRAKRMQESTSTGHSEIMRDLKGGSSKEADAGEAERALSVVEKKLSKTLSTSATVNELIQQATDERNLATLFSGWAAYF